MSRPEGAIDPQWPLASFASGLRALRAQRGLKYRQLARRAHCSQGALSRAASGRYLPTWEITRAYVLACGGSADQWQDRWREARDLLRAQNGSSRD